ncbi:hypothetical protein GOP47_0019296 [Adiantum capillus-veneris]|uniref:PiggyBac transposable element-derived protein domain-containing protein n=1 Tax=Adiantum capillus-veneris TaxID=13818 RepID=A0A9D4UFE2_ADICA|nr:hypothetical protein GOP47_0019296 [Adiantum capillus-veneris]
MDTTDDALTMNALSTHVEETNEEAPFLSTFASIATMPLVGVSGAPPMTCKRGRPPKPVIMGRGRPKAQDADLICDGSSNNVNVDTHDAFRKAHRNHARRIHDANGDVESSHARGKGYKILKKRGKVKNMHVKKGRKSSVHEEGDSCDEHGSVGEEDECEDELLEAEGPVLPNSDDESDWSNVTIPSWKSGDKMHVEPDGTFKVLPTFVDIGGPNLGQVQKELTEIQLFLALFPLDLIDMIVGETNRYALEKQEQVLCKYGSTRRWKDLDRHSFLRFIVVYLGMALQYMLDKNYYWKGETYGVMHYSNYAEKMGQTEYQKIKCFLHVKDNSQSPLLRGMREHKLWQVLPLEERLKAMFQLHFNCGQNVTVDERIIPSKCKLNPCRVYNPKKPHKFGIPLWNLCDSETGYGCMANFLVQSFHIILYLCLQKI